MSQPVKTMSLRFGERNKVLDQRRFVVGALAEANGAHLCERADGLGEPAANGFDSGDHGGGNGAQANDHHSQFALCGLWLDDGSGLVAALFCIAHRFS